MTAWAQFWARSTWLAHIPADRGFVTHTAGSGFGDVRPGDRVYLLGRDADEYLLGRVTAAARSQYMPDDSDTEAIFDQDEAERLLEAELWQARQHLIAPAGDRVGLRLGRVVPRHVAPDLTVMPSVCRLPSTLASMFELMIALED